MAVASLRIFAQREVVILAHEPIAGVASMLLAVAGAPAAIITRPAPGVTGRAVVRAAGSIMASHRGCLLVEKLQGGHQCHRRWFAAF